jgi:hypothetical protein
VTKLRRWRSTWRAKVRRVEPQGSHPRPLDGWSHLVGLSCPDLCSCVSSGFPLCVVILLRVWDHTGWESCLFRVGDRGVTDFGFSPHVVLL